MIAEGHTIPCHWDGTREGLGDGIDTIIAGAFHAREAHRAPTALCALAAEVRPRFQGGGVANRMLDVMADLAREAGLAHLIAPVRPSLKDRYPITPIGQYVSWTRENGEPFDLTKAHGDEQAAALGADFCHAVRAELPRFGGTQVKTIGDALVLRIEETRQAVLLGLRVAHDVLGGHGAPAVRVGMHHGPAIERDGDYIGATVNLAARVSAAATAGEVLLTAQTAALAPEIDGVLYKSRGRQLLRNVRDPVELVTAVRQGRISDQGLAIDPVCQMAVDPDRAAGRLNNNDTTYFFCTLTCAGAFARHPERFAERSRAG